MTQFYCQIHFNLSTSETQAQHIFGVISVATCPLTSVTPKFLICFQVTSKNILILRIYARKWEIEGMTSLWIVDHI
nr:hypothetical protein CFP56_72748 [Quercus suber]